MADETKKMEVTMLITLTVEVPKAMWKDDLKEHYGGINNVLEINDPDPMFKIVDVEVGNIHDIRLSDKKS